MQFAAWNVQILMGTKKNKRPERMTTIVGYKLLRYNIDIDSRIDRNQTGRYR